MRVQIQLAVEDGVGVGLGNDLTEVGFEFGAGKHGDGVAADLLKRVVLLLPQIPASELVIPGAIGELRNRGSVDRFHFARHPVLLQKRGEPLVETGVIRVAVDLRAVHTQRVQRTVQGRQAGKIFVQHLDVLTRARAGLSREPGVRTDRHSGSFGRQFPKQLVIQRELLIGAVRARQGIGNLHRHGDPCRSSRKGGQVLDGPRRSPWHRRRTRRRRKPSRRAAGPGSWIGESAAPAASPTGPRPRDGNTRPIFRSGSHTPREAPSSSAGAKECRSEIPATDRWWRYLYRKRDRPDPN